MREVAAKLWIGNALETRDVSAVYEARIESIVDLAIEERPIMTARDIICCRIPISDGAGNPPARIQLAIATICNLIQSERPTLVACSAGMSRSPAFVAAALSRLNRMSIDDALVQVAATGPCDVSPVLLAEISQHVEVSNDDEPS